MNSVQELIASHEKNIAFLERFLDHPLKSAQNQAKMQIDRNRRCIRDLQTNPFAE